MTIIESAGLDDGDRGQIVGVDVLIELGCVRDVFFARGQGPHELGLVLEGIADVAVPVVGIRFSGVGHVEIPALAVVLEGNILRHQRIADAFNI